MRAVEITSFGMPDVLRLGDRPKPEHAPGEVLLRVTASGVNRPDVLQRTGHYPVPAGASDIPGLEVAGVVEQGDADAMALAGIAIGDRVCALVAGGGYAEWCVASASLCLPVPAKLSDVEAAALPENYFTVWSNVFDRGALQAGETLLVQGGSSGIGITAIQLAKARGATVIATAGSDEKCAACIAQGADHAINYKTADFSAEVLRLTADRGADVILDMVAGDYVSRELACLAEDGRLVCIATQGGAKAEVNIGQLMRRCLTMTGSTLRPRSVAFKAAIARSLREQVWPLLANGQLKPVIHRTFPAAQAADSHRLMESGTLVGKTILTW